MKKIILTLTGVLCCFAIYATDPIVKVGRTWFYDRTFALFGWVDSERPREYYGSASFDGSYIEQNNHVYYGFKWENEDKPCAYLRQDGDKVYLLIHEYSNFSKSLSDELGGEILLYDFSLKAGQTYDTYYTYVTLIFEFLERGIIRYANSMTVNGVERRCQLLDTYSIENDLALGENTNPTYYGMPDSQIVEGIGPLRGFITEPLNDWIVSGGMQTVYYMTKVCDGDVEIFNENDFKLFTAGVEEVSDSRKNGDGKMYDMMGREVKNPQPGSLYIMNGRKFVAR